MEYNQQADRCSKNGAARLHWAPGRGRGSRRPLTAHACIYAFAIVCCGTTNAAMQALGARSTLLAACLSRPQPLRLASRSGRTFKSTWTAPVAAAPPRTSSGGKPSAGAATVQQRRTAASSSSTDALQLPRVILKGGKSKLFTGGQGLGAAAPRPSGLSCRAALPLVGHHPSCACGLLSAEHRSRLTRSHLFTVSRFAVSNGLLGGGGPGAGPAGTQGGRYRAGVRRRGEDDWLGRV